MSNSINLWERAQREIKPVTHMPAYPLKVKRAGRVKVIPRIRYCVPMVETEVLSFCEQYWHYPSEAYLWGAHRWPERGFKRSKRQAEIEHNIFLAKTMQPLSREHPILKVLTKIMSGYAGHFCVQEETKEGRRYIIVVTDAWLARLSHV